MTEFEKLFPPTSIYHITTKSLWFYRKISFLLFSTLPIADDNECSLSLSSTVGRGDQLHLEKTGQHLFKDTFQLVFKDTFLKSRSRSPLPPSAHQYWQSSPVEEKL